MAEAEPVVLTPEQERIFTEVEAMVAGAILKHCAGCSTANFAPGRMGMAVARERASHDTAAEIAERLSACAGLSDGMCHYPPAK